VAAFNSAVNSAQTVMILPSSRVVPGTVAWATTLALMFATPVHAQVAPPPPPIGTEAVTPQASEAETLADQGREAYRTGNYAEAYRLFEHSLQLHENPKIIYNLARTKEKLADYKAAVQLLDRYLDAYRRHNGGQEPADVNDVQRLQRDLKQRAFEALPEVSIQSHPSGAQVFVGEGGSTLGSTPLVTHMEPGRYKVTIKLPNYADAEAELAVPVSGRVNLMLSLKSKLKRAGLSVWANVRGAQIIVDGKTMAVTPFSGTLDLDAGKHQVLLSREGYKPVEESVTLPDEQVLVARYEMRPSVKTGSFRPWLGSLLAIAGGGSIAGGYAARSAAEEEYTGSPRFRELESWQNRGYRIGSGLIALGVAFVVWDAVRSDIPAEDRVDGRQFDAGKEWRPMLKEGP
jgi:hypothetical protein